MRRTLWWKFMINVGMNQASALMRAPYGVFQTSEDARALMRALMQEVITLAQASAVNLAEADIEDWCAILQTLSAEGKTSMLQDIEAGRQTEVDVFGGKVVALGKALDIITPVNAALRHAIRVLECPTS
jgi:2-dehydropantoate 2-reductase